MPRYRYILFLIAILCAALAGSTPAQAQARKEVRQRVKVIVANYATSPVIDSTFFIYSGQRGSRFYPLFITSGSDDLYPSIPFAQGVRLLNEPEPFYAYGSRAVQYDTLYRRFYNPAMVYAEMRYATYRDTVLLSSSIPWSNTLWQMNVVSDTVANRKWYMVYNYDSLRRVTDTNSSTVLQYNPDNQLMYEATRYQQNAAYSVNTNYEYNTAGMLSTAVTTFTSNGPLLEERTVYTYNSKGLATGRTITQLKGGSQRIDTVTVESVGYDAYGRISQLVSKAWSVSGIGWMQVHYNSNGDMDTVTHGNDLGNALRKFVHFYNDRHNPDSTYLFQQATSDSLDLHHIRRYYYEDYEVDADTTAIVGKDQRPVLYPNPAKDHINIWWGSSKPAGAANVVIYNSAGQLVRQQRIASPQPNEKITLPALSQGTYYIRITTAGGGLIYRSAFVVAG